jgi:glycosyltransferase involved in cell wall biosynthesis
MKGHKVLILVENYPLPFDRRVWLEAKTLTAAGYHVSIICPKGKGAMESYVELEGIRIYRYRAYEADYGLLAFMFEFTYCWIRTFLLTLKVLFRDGFDVIHACNPPDTFFLIGLIYRPFGKRFIFDQHDLCPEVYLSKFPDKGGSLAHRALLWFERMTYRAAHVVISMNESYRAVALERGKVDPERVFVVRTGPDVERLHPVPPDAGLRNGARHLVCYLGTMAPQDGVDYLLRAADHIVNQRKRTDVRFALIGGGPSLDDLKSMAARLGLADHVDFPGRVTDADLRRWLASADVCAGPDPRNPLNEVSTMNKTMEYMAMGKPVVSFALKETVYSAADASLYAEPNDVVEFGDRIIELLDDPARREAMGAYGLTRVREKLGWVHSEPLLLRAYERALAGVPSRRLRIFMIGQKGVPATYGGIERHVEEIGARLAARGHEVTVYCRPHYSRRGGMYRGMRLLHRPSVNTKHLDTLTHTLACTIDVIFRRAHIVHYHALGPSPFSIFPRFRGISTIVTVHGLDWEREKWGALAAYILERCEYPAIHFPNATIAVSRTLQEYFTTKYMIQPRFIPNGTPEAVVRPPGRIREWGLGENGYVLFVGRLTPEKGCHFLLEAWSRIESDLRLVVAGGTSFTDDYVASLEALKDDRVLMTGYVYGDVLAELWTNALFVVLPSTMEGLSIALLEAVSYGKCVLVSDIPENVEVTGEYAPRFESRNVDDLETKMRQLLESPELIAKYASLTRERIARRYAWDTIVDDLERCYFEVVAGRSVMTAVQPPAIHDSHEISVSRA